MDIDRIKAKEEMKKQSKKTKIENFWFYYKKHVLIGLFVLIVLVSEVTRFMNRIDYDLEGAIYTQSLISEERLGKVKEILKDTAIDVNENGTLDIEVYSYDGEIDKNHLSQDTQAVLSKLQAELVLGECPFYIVDEVYKDYILGMDENLSDLIVDLSEVPLFKEKLNLQEDETLYWVSMTKRNDKEENQFHNSDIVEEKLFK